MTKEEIEKELSRYYHQCKSLHAKNRLMIDLIQEVLACENDDIDWDSWDERAKEVLRANKREAVEINEKRNEERREERRRKKAVAWAERQKFEGEKAAKAISNAPETSLYHRSLIKSAERRMARNGTQEKSAD